MYFFFSFSPFFFNNNPNQAYGISTFIFACDKTAFFAVLCHSMPASMIFLLFFFYSFDAFSLSQFSFKKNHSQIPLLKAVCAMTWILHITSKLRTIQGYFCGAFFFENFHFISKISNGSWKYRWKLLFISLIQAQV